MSKPRVTVVTVVCNDAVGLQKTILSVAEQTYSDIEYLVVDGGSEEKTIEVIKNYEEHITYWMSKPDEGIYHAMNRAIVIARGEWIVFMNSGEKFVSSDIIELVMSNIEEDTDFLYGDRYRIGEDLSMVYQKAGRIEDILLREVVYHQALFTRTSILKKRPYSTFYSLAADYEYVVNAWSKGYKFQYFPFAICVFSAGGKNRIYSIKSMVEGMKISMDYEPDKSQWKKSDFFKNFVGNHIGSVIWEHLQRYFRVNPDARIGLIEKKGAGFVLDTSPSNLELDRIFENISRPFREENVRLFFSPLDPELNVNIDSQDVSTKLKITIVTVVYNDPDGLIRTIQSIKELKYTNIEYLVIDGGSTDETISIAERNNEIISYFESEPDEGTYNAMNKAIDLASGDYVIFMNAGDTFASETVLGDMFDKIDDYPDVIYGNRNYVSTNGDIKLQEAKEIDTLFERMPYCHQAAFVKLSVLRKFKFVETYKFAADYNQLVEMYKTGCVFKKNTTIVCNFFAGGKSESGLRPYLEAIKVQMDNVPNDNILHNSAYIKAFVRNSDKLFSEYL